VLSVNDLSVYYGGVRALDNVSIEIRSGEIVAIIGSNGAGKSTFLNALMGLIHKSGGTVTFHGEMISDLRTEEIVARRISLVPETRELFPRMTCKDNLRMGVFLCHDKRLFEERLESVYGLFPRLKERHRQLAGTLSGGEQQMLAIGRAIMQDPRLLLLDEPSLGLSPNITSELFQRITEIRDTGRAVLLVEQKAHIALEVADRGYLLTVGRVTRSGTSVALRDDELVRKVYFGE